MEGDVVKSFSANWSRSQPECQRVSVQGAENLHGQTSSALQTSVHAAVLKSSDELSATRRAAADVAGRSVNGKDKEAGFKRAGNGLATVVLIWIILFDCIRVASSWLLSSHFVDFIKHLCYLLCNLVFSVLCAAAITRWHEFQTKQEHFPPGYMIGLADMLTVHVSLCCQCI